MTYRLFQTHHLIELVDLSVGDYRIKAEWQMKLCDWWIGAFWRLSITTLWVWLCIIPGFPLHIAITSKSKLRAAMIRDAIENAEEYEAMYDDAS